MMLLAISTKKVDFYHSVFISPSKAALTELSLPPALPTPVPPTHIYIYMYVLCGFCPSAYLCLCQGMPCKQLEVWRSGEESDSLTSMFTIILYHTTAGRVFFFRMYIQCFNKKYWVKGIVRSLQGWGERFVLFLFCCCFFFNTFELGRDGKSPPSW